MEVKNILKLAIIFLDRKELLEDEIFLSIVPEDYVASEERTKEIQELLLCLNLICSEIAREYIPVLTEEEITFEDEKFLYSLLSKTILDLHSLKTTTGRNVKYKLFPTYIKANTTEAVITYSYEPDELLIDSSIISFASRIPARVFAYGTAMEFAFLNSLSTEALIWESRYKNSLLELTRKKSEITLPARRWI